jgi:hypothetical protein
MKESAYRMLSTMCAHRARDICDGAPCVDNQCKILRGGTEHQRYVIVPVRNGRKVVTPQSSSYFNPNFDR